MFASPAGVRQVRAPCRRAVPLWRGPLRKGGPSSQRFAPHKTGTERCAINRSRRDDERQRPPPSDAAGHRARLRKRLLDSNGDGLHDYELIEYLLALAIPRQDTKPLAKELLRRFGSLPKLLDAEPEALAQVKGMGETSVAALKTARAVATACSAPRRANHPCSRAGRRCSTI
jgi:hypothetical protein